MNSVRDVLLRGADWGVDCGDARQLIKKWRTDSVHCVVTSPPYFGLRDYGTTTWEGGDPQCDHAAAKKKSRFDYPVNSDVSIQNPHRTGTDAHSEAHRCPSCGAVKVDQQIGLEQTPDEYVAQLVEVFRGVRRVLHPTGMLWLNLGDSFANDTKWGESSGGKHAKDLHGDTGIGRGKKHTGLKAKDLIGIPWMVAFALRADGWYLRQWMPWVKRNPMPESADDRPSTSCETVFLLAKNPDYYFDMDDVKRRASTEPHAPGNKKLDASRNDADSMDKVRAGDGMRNFRSGDLWFDSVGMLFDPAGDSDMILGIDVCPAPYKGSHFATFPKKLVRPMILAGTSERGVCPHCGAPWVRQTEKVRTATRPGTGSKVTGDSLTDGNRDPERHVTKTTTTGWAASCACTDNAPVPSIVADPFAGSGTVLAVARELGRRAIGTELNPEYLKLIAKRVGGATPRLV